MLKNKMRVFFTLLAAVLCMAAFSVTAFADGGDYYDDEIPVVTLIPADPATVEEVIPEPAPVPTETAAPVEEPVPAFTPDGNLSLIDDFLFSGMTEDGEKEEKQFITVQSKNGNYFFIIIDRVGDEENVYFLNMVDEADLLALMEDGETEETPATCICTDRCYAGHVDTSCPVCAVNMFDCAGLDVQPEPTLEPAPEPEPEPEAPAKSSAALGLVLLLLLGGAGGAVYYFKFRKPKADTKGPVNLDDYDYGDEDDEEEPEYADDESEDESEGEDEDSR